MTTRSNDRDLAPTAGIYVIFVVLFVNGIFGLLALGGTALLSSLAASWFAGNLQPLAVLLRAVFGLVMTAIGLGFFYFTYVAAPKVLDGMEAERDAHRSAPWLAQPDWRARRVVHSRRKSMWFMWVWSAGWWTILGFLCWVNGDEIAAALRGPWSEALPTMLFFAAGALGVAIAIGLTVQRYRYGDAVLRIDTLPGFLGDQFRGRVELRLGRRLAARVTVHLVCGRKRETRQYRHHRANRTVWVTDELWSDMKDVHPTQAFYRSGRIVLPIEFDLPPDLPESGHVLDEPQLVWTIRIQPEAPADQPLQSEFVIPVYARRDTAVPGVSGGTASVREPPYRSAEGNRRGLEAE